MQHEEMILTFIAGRLLCGQIREYLEARKFEGYTIRWREGRGWFEREWIIRGDPEDVRKVQRDLKKWSRELSRELSDL